MTRLNAVFTNSKVLRSAEPYANWLGKKYIALFTPRHQQFANEENTEGDNPSIGIILSRQKDELLVGFATYGMNSELFVQKYQLYLPDREALRRELELSLQGGEP